MTLAFKLYTMYALLMNLLWVGFLQNPPSIIKLVMESVCVMLNMKPERKPDGSTGNSPKLKIVKKIHFKAKY